MTYRRAWARHHVPKDGALTDKVLGRQSTDPAETSIDHPRCGPAEVGTHITISTRHGDKRQAFVRHHNSKLGRHTIEYEDGSAEDVDLNKSIWVKASRLRPKINASNNCKVGSTDKTDTAPWSGKRKRSDDRLPKEGPCLGPDICGQRISIYWEDEEEWYSGRISDYDRGTHVVVYDHGITQFVNLSHKIYRLIDQIQGTDTPIPEGLATGPAADGSLTGKRIKLYLEKEKRWASGMIASFKNGRHLIRFDDREEEWFDVAKCFYELVVEEHTDGVGRGGAVAEKNGEEMVGQRIKVLWDDNIWYDGEISEYDPEKGQHLISYDDYDQEWHTLADEKIKKVAEKRRRRNVTPVTQSLLHTRVTWMHDDEKLHGLITQYRGCLTKRHKVEFTNGTSHWLDLAQEMKMKTLLVEDHHGTGSKGAAALESITLDGEEFSVGDAVYVVLDDNLLPELRHSTDADFDDDIYRCALCRGDDSDSNIMIECGECLRGYHLSCLDPPLSEVPDCAWLCPNCVAGKAPPPRRAACAREFFLQGCGLGLARIDAIWQVKDTMSSKNKQVPAYEFAARWYDRPEETHVGRQQHQAAREVFLRRNRDVLDVGTIHRKAKVLSGFDFNKDRSGEEDVFLCDYYYDPIWKRFHRRTLFGSDSEDSDDDDGNDCWEWNPQLELSNDDDEEDATFRPIDALPGLKARMHMNTLGKRRLKHNVQGGGELQVDRMLAPEFLPQGGDAPCPGGEEGMSLKAVRDALTLSAIPKTLTCREKEREQILEFVDQAIQQGGSSHSGGRCLYVCGIPGTGKTATILDVMRSMKKKLEAGKVGPFQFVEINGLRLPSPNHAYSTLHEALTGDRLCPSAAQAALEVAFTHSTSKHKKRHGGPLKVRHPVIVLVDELDQLISKNQSVLYNLFEWPTHVGSKLSIIGVANTMDLPERLQTKIASRLGGNRIVFHPYSRANLTSILESRLEDFPNVFDRNALELATRKVANCSGDVRRCLEICRRGAELREAQLFKEGNGAHSDEPLCVKIQNINAAIQEMFKTPHVKMLEGASRLERLLLAALLLEGRYTGRLDATMAAVYDRIKGLLAGHKDFQFAGGAVIEAVAHLNAKRLIICDAPAKRIHCKIALNVPIHELTSVLISDSGLPWLADRVKVN